MTTVQKIRRRILLAEKGAQFRIISWFLIHLLIYTTLTIAAIMLPSVLHLAVGGFSLEEQFAAGQEFLLFDLRVVPVLLVMALVGAVHFLFITHRIFGPLVRLRGALRRWREQGIYPGAMHVRRHDFHGLLFDEFSLSATALSEDLVAARELVGHAAARAESLAQAQSPGPGNPGEEAQAIAGACRRALERLDRWQR